jgi:beta-galactosidase
VAWDQVALRAARAARALPRFTPNHAAAAVDEVLVSPVELTIWRAAVDNDGFKLMPELAKRIRVGGQALGHWYAAGVDHSDADELVRHTWDRAVAADGSVEYRHVVDVPDQLADLPRIGVQFTLPAGFDLVRWFGRGPGENYPDRLAGSLLGTWESAPDTPPYLVPQEFGLRCDCRWVELVATSGAWAGRRVRVDVLQPHAMHASAVHFTTYDLFAARTETDLRPRPELVVHLDVAHRGVGTATCGPDVLPQYRLAAGRHEFAYRLSVV